MPTQPAYRTHRKAESRTFGIRGCGAGLCWLCFVVGVLLCSRHLLLDEADAESVEPDDAELEESALDEAELEESSELLDR